MCRLAIITYGRTYIIHPVSEVTRILSQFDVGDPTAAEQLLPLVYDELRRLAAHRMAAERPDHTLSATGLVHEAYLRLVGSPGGQAWENRGHFFSAAAEAMRRILVEIARRRQSAKRGGGWERVDLDEADLPFAEPAVNLLAIDDAIARLREDDPQAADLVKLRYFAGLPLDEAAQCLGISRATASRYWAYAKAFLVCELLEGRPLDQLVAGGPLSPERVVDLGLQLVDALAAVHARGIVHGNIKPSNVFITDDRHVKLLEVGLMTAWWESVAAPAVIDDSTPTASMDRRVVADKEVGGFHAYRSPEQVRGEHIDHRSDLFSAGAVLYDMATARRAFRGTTPEEIAAAIVSQPPAPVRESNPEVPQSIAAIIERALAHSWRVTSRRARGNSAGSSRVPSQRRRSWVCRWSNEM